jgi:predicted RNA methylase
MTIVSSPAAADAPLLALACPKTDAPYGLADAARLLLPHLEHGQRIDAVALRAAMEHAFGGSDAAGAWDWKTAYDACEAATVLFLRKFGPAIRAQAASPAGVLQMLGRVAALLPTHTRRSQESQALQQFSTPIELAFAAATAAAVGPADVVLEPSAGTGLLAIFAELAGSRLVLNELAEARAGLLNQLFPGVPITRHDAAHIHDHLDRALRPSVILMNPPFSVAAHVDGVVGDAALRHVASALARLADGGRLSAPTDSAVSWTAGLNYFRSALSMDRSGRTTTPAFATIRGLMDNDFITNSWSAFGEATVPVVGGLKATLGLRGTLGSKMANYNFNGAGQAGVVPFFAQNNSLSDNFVTGRGGLSYDWTEQIMTYLSVARGYVTAGFPSVSVNTPLGKARASLPSLDELDL